MGKPDLARLTKFRQAQQGKLTLTLAITAAIASFGSSVPHGWNTGVLNAPSYLIKDFLNETFTIRFGYSPDKNVLNILWATTVSIYLIGGCAGALSVSWLADRFGRKKSLLICHVFGFVAAILFATCDVAKSFEMLILARLIVGIGCGAGSGLVPMYLTESAPVNIRGAMGVIHQLGLTIGILLSQIIGLRQVLGHEDRWPYLLALTALPCLVSLIILPFCPESPRCLLCNLHDENAATKALQRFRGTDDVTTDMNEMRKEQEDRLREPAWTFRQLLGSKALRLPLILVCCLNMGQQLSGINVIFYYSTGVFESAGITQENIQYAVLGTGVINVLMTGISVPLMEKAGRKPLLLIGMFLMMASAAVITVALNLQDSINWFSYISILCTIGFVIGFAIGLGSIPQFIGAELFKQGPRPPAMSVAGMLNWLCNFIIGISFPSMQDLLKAYSFIVFIVILLAFAVFFIRKLPETKNKTYDEIYQIFQHGAKPTDPEAHLNGYGSKHSNLENEILLADAVTAKPIYKPPADKKDSAQPTNGSAESSTLLSDQDKPAIHGESAC